ncbi:DNA-binding transcriptional MocR family regulator [Kibdelosporangium banguiense]|uniref:DNA-binding transcriptional MocR family regulator n=1 Tax=Kibdelosporangium banguiense TaxID=1365924 RepID=A0ABS4T5X6_9PSEU|nr:PLP-dependent aminotransferase family protein [Kibdelosporangium banguiense]MBP2319862.1 DNA-binding transcriptional MocR family regulator [Kibdelosporangium banguiense]
MDEYRWIADALAGEIAAGRLQPGDQLPPQREFARRNGIANSTAARVYKELVRRGLAVGEVGRGTFIRTADRPIEPALAEPGNAKIDLELNFCILPGQAALLAESTGKLLRSDVMSAALRPVGVSGTPGIRAAAAEMMAREKWRPNPDEILCTGNGRQAIAAAIAALVPVGGRLGVEALTYPVVKAIATRLGITLVPLQMDDAGVIPEALSAARVRTVYLQPTLHNPLGVTMPLSRRDQINEVLCQQEMYAIEDNIYGFLGDDLPPLAPGRTIIVDSLSKRLAPGLTVGFAAVPPLLLEQVASAVRSGGWTAQHFAIEAATRWLTDGTAAQIEAAKREDAFLRQKIADEHLGVVAGERRAYHRWWTLPEPWRAETFVAAAARHGIAITPAAAFAVGPGHAPNAVRIALSAPHLDTLALALDTLAQIARSDPYEGWDM